jgi:RHS repeat-associated protein
LQQAVLTTSTGSTVTTTYQWDANGHLIQKAAPSQLTQYSWRSDNRLVQVQQGGDASHLQTVATYSYDDLGNRVQRTTFVSDPSNPGSGTLVPQVTDYLVDDNFPYAETLEEIQTTNAGQTSRTLYTWGNDLISANLNNSLAMNTVQTYYEPDGLGSILSTSNPQGQVTASYRYGAFGQAYGVAAGDPNPYRFTGQYFDSAAGLQYNRARWYDPDTALFLSMDPDPGLIEQPKTLPRFLYAAADPVNNSDPSGAVTLGEVMTAAESAADMASEAITTFQSVFGDPNDDGPENGPPTFFDNLMAYLVRVVANSLGQNSGGRIGPATLLAGGTRSPERHHVIPKYVCGADDQTLSLLPYVVHRKLHDELYVFPAGIDLFGYSLKYLIFRRVTRPLPTPTQWMGRKRIGRAAIAAGLGQFYYKMDYFDDGIPPIWLNYVKETPRFIWNHYNSRCEL